MVRLLAIDLGDARVGLALSDDDASLALPHRVLRRKSDRQVIEELLAVVANESIGTIVLGEPLSVDGTSGPAAQRSHSFARKLRRSCPCEVVLWPETLTTDEAARRLRDRGVTARRQREMIDAVAAQVLLEDYLARVARVTDRSEAT